MSDYLWLASVSDLTANDIITTLIAIAREDWRGDLCEIERATSRWTVTFAGHNDYCFDLWQVTPEKVGTGLSDFTWVYWAQLRVCYAMARRLGLQVSFENNEESSTVTERTASITSFREYAKRRMKRYKGRPEMADEFWEELFVGSPPHWQGAPREIHMIKDTIAYDAALAAYTLQREAI